MSDRTAIEWTDATWNPVTGCTKVSPGCANCYIERTPAFRMTRQRFERGRIPVRLHHDRLDQPLHWRKPRRVFVVSMGDLFHEDVPDWFLIEVFALMYKASRHTFQVLTKRPERMQRFLAEMGGWGVLPWMPSNVWLGVTAENQRMADERIPLLLETPAAVRFVSCEPLLGPLNVQRHLCSTWPYHEPGHGCRGGQQPTIDWVIAGGESGARGRNAEKRRLVERCEWKHQDMIGPNCQGGYRAKSAAEDWARSLRDQCQAADVPFFWKQWGPKAGQGTLLDGREWREMPQREAVPA